MSYNMHANPATTPNLWIGELDNWMDEKYLVKSLESYGKLKL